MKIECPQCGTGEGLRGQREDDGIRITRGSCGHAWVRHPDGCPECGERALASVRAPLYQKTKFASEAEPNAT
jgi:DNA-directed RNA polymerase subunit RPC12/RpoP